MTDKAWARLPRLGDLGRVVDQSPLATLMFGLPDQRIRRANDAAADLIGAPAPRIVGLRPTELWHGEDARRSQLAFSVLAAGGLDSFRAQRTLRTRNGLQDVWIWARRLRVAGGSVAMAILVPEEESNPATRAIAAFFGPDAINLAVGTLDTRWHINRITPNSHAVLGHDQHELVGVELPSLAHPEDSDRLVQALEDTATDTDGAFVRARLRHGSRVWTECRCLLFPLPPQAAPPPAPASGAPAVNDDDASDELDGESTQTALAFAIGEAGADPFQGPDTERILVLERDLLRFAAELHAGAWSTEPPIGLNPDLWAKLAELPSRQHEIVDGLLRGQRIPAIARSMYINPSTARNHLSQVFATFGVHSQAELLALLLGPPPDPDPGPDSTADPASAPASQDRGIEPILTELLRS
jgi:PAS domain-containing protein/DNA-binding CsgD family transcriptional regulator